MKHTPLIIICSLICSLTACQHTNTSDSADVDSTAVAGTDSVAINEAGVNSALQQYALLGDVMETNERTYYCKSNFDISDRTEEDITETHTFTEEGDIAEEEGTTYKYDNNHRLISAVSEEQTDTYVYDEHGRIYIHHWEWEGELGGTASDTITYTPQGETHQLECISEGNCWITTSTYQYTRHDKQGNWTEAHVTVHEREIPLEAKPVDNTLYRVIIRDIKYY